MSHGLSRIITDEPRIITDYHGLSQMSTDEPRIMQDLKEGMRWVHGMAGEW